ncbi:S-methyl-5-thioribose kinase [Paraburkholderia gardini]|uniref:S-methyl-5-thioribose kinase n=1 Tax=Paraburkholderia gardini TaxID=2823469 RepID=A0ABN7QJ38_9BURK|nr:S-methyl-5-thioribose kinase [Paraburkholderia gardini]CAG4888494.1 Methylthioribose kinase [Paraburkholderia gardini]CAG4891835.1 Methylthioribose kinase [Paraburkholderia gardini]
MEFEALSSSELSAYLRGVPAVYALLNEPGELDIAEVGDGNLNFVYFVSNAQAPEKSVVVKQAPPFLRLVGKSWPLTRHRMEREVAALQRFGALCPQHVPRVYHADSELFLMVMQRLSSHRILRQGLMDGVVYPKLAAHLSTYLAHTLFYGSDLFLAPDVKKQAVRDAVNSELCKITEDLVFTYPFEDHPSNVYSPAFPRAEIGRLRQSPALRIAVAEMKWAFMNDAETLLHGDLHTGSIMVNQDETYVIDPEFAFYGPMGFDIGAVLANLLLAYFSRDWHDRHQTAGRHGNAGATSYRDWLLDQVTSIWSGFEQTFLALWRDHESRRKSHFIGDDPGGVCVEAYRARFMQRLLAESLGFAGCKMIRRIVGMAKVADITSIADNALRAVVEVRALRCAERLLLERTAIGNIAQVVSMARELQADGRA